MINFFYTTSALVTLMSFVLLGIAYQSTDDKLINVLLGIFLVSAVLCFIFYSLKTRPKN